MKETHSLRGEVEQRYCLTNGDRQEEPDGGGIGLKKLK